MILCSGIIFNQFIVLLLLGTVTGKSKILMLKRIGLSIILIMSICMLEIDMEGKEIWIQDGLLEITNIKLLGCIYLRPEIYILILTNLVGIQLLIISKDLTLFIIAWELFNLSLYLLVSSQGEKIILPVSLKYFLLSALSTGILFLGILLIYISTGSTQYETIETLFIYEKVNIGSIDFISIDFKIGSSSNDFL